MYSGDMPSYSPPARSFITPRKPSDYQNPFADKPTLRGTNSDSIVFNPGSQGVVPVIADGSLNRRPIPPPSLMPGQERIPFRPPDLSKAGDDNMHHHQHQSHPLPPAQPPVVVVDQRKKGLNTPAQIVPPQQHNKELTNVTDAASVQLHFPSISRILSGSNGRKEDIPEVLLRTVTARPVHNYQPVVRVVKEDADDTTVLLDDDVNDDDDEEDDDGTGAAAEEMDDADDEDDTDDDKVDEPKTQPKILVAKSTQSPLQSDLTSTGLVVVTSSSTTTTTTTVASEKAAATLGSSDAVATWAIVWNVHVYLSAILFTVLAVYSIFKMIFYDKLTHLFNQSYFICIHLILIIICLVRIFFLCYDAYNIHSSFHRFVAELLLNLPATFLTICFAILILFLLIRSLNHKNNRYSALMRPLTVVVASSVHVGLCITLHYVESTTIHPMSNANHHHHHQQQQQQYFHRQQRGGGTASAQPPRVLSLICQIIYIFVCLALGTFYLYAYRNLKRVLRNKSQNYIHGYQNLSYAIHITIATALLFILLAALQVYGAISISTTRPLISSTTDIDWLQCGYQFSLRLIEIAIITLLSWVTGLKTGAAAATSSKQLHHQRGEKDSATGGGGGNGTNGFALFPCTSSSSQEHFDTDYPAICNANTNLHTYTLRTGKPIYDGGGERTVALQQPQQQSSLDYLPNSNEFTRTLEPIRNNMQTDPSDHYENPNFELRGESGATAAAYPLAAEQNSYEKPGYDFQNFEKPIFDRAAAASTTTANFCVAAPVSTATVGGTNSEFRASKNLKAMKTAERHERNAGGGGQFDRQQWEQPERRSGNSSTHSYGTGGWNLNNLNYMNSFERRSGIRKSGTLNNIGGGGGSGAQTGLGAIHVRGGGGGAASSTSSTSSAGGGRSSGVQTLSTR